MIILKHTLCKAEDDRNAHPLHKRHMLRCGTRVRGQIQASNQVHDEAAQEDGGKASWVVRMELYRCMDTGQECGRENEGIRTRNEAPLGLCGSTREGECGDRDIDGWPMQLQIQSTPADRSP
jgi:hypothetical protein